MKRSSSRLAASAGGRGIKQEKKTTLTNGVVECVKEDKQKDVSPYFTETNNNHNQVELEARKAVLSKVVGVNVAGSSKGICRLPKSFYDQECLNLCEALLGKVLVRRLESGEVLRGTIVETEAYPGGTDRASQSFQGKRTPRNEAMFMAPGTAYVYFTYGMYFCFNISSKGDGAACLIRGVEPLEDYGTMHQLRKSKKKGLTQEKRLKTYELANGPSKLCIAFDVSRDKCDKIDMAISEDLWLETSKDLKYLNRNFEVATDKRIGIDSTPPEARNKLWRFYVKDSLAESRAKVGEIKKRLGITDL